MSLTPDIGCHCCISSCLYKLLTKFVFVTLGDSSGRKGAQGLYVYVGSVFAPLEACAVIAA